MKIKKLQIHNIASIEDALIDFETGSLADADVFLISGKTGAGKSTILDAISLALYATTPRLENTRMKGDVEDTKEDTVKINDTRQLLRRNTGEGFVQLDFRGTNGVDYQAKWYVQRARKKVDGKLQGKQWSLRRLDTDITYSKDKEIAEEIAVAVGLSFEQFCRTTLLAQGEFTRFLNSNDADKAEILERITGVDIYSEIGRKVFSLTSLQRTAYERAKAAVEGVELLSEEQIAEKNKELVQLQASVEALKKQRESVRVKLDWIKKAEELALRVEQARARLAGIQELMGSEEFKRKQGTVALWDTTVDVRSWIVNRDAASRNLTALYEQLRSKSDKFRREYASILGEHAGNDVMKDIATVKAIYENEHEAVCRQITELEQAVAAADLPKLRKDERQFERILLNLKSAPAVLDAITSAREQRRKSEEDLRNLEQEIKAKRTELDGLAPQLEEAKKDKERLEAERDKQRETVDKVLSKFRATLQVGDVCPVCQQRIMAAIPSEEELKEVYRKAEQEFNSAKSLYDNLVGRNNKLSADVGALTRQEKLSSDKLANDRTVDTAIAAARGKLAELGIEEWDGDIAAMKLSLEEMDKRTRADLAKTAAAIKAAESLESDIKARQKRKDGIVVRQKQVDALTAELSVLDGSIKTKKDDVSRYKDLVAQYIEAHPDHTEAVLVELNGRGVRAVDACKAAIEQTRTQAVSAKSVVETHEASAAEHALKKPQFSEDDSADFLEQTDRDFAQQLSENERRIGGLVQELRGNEDKKNKQGKLIEEKDRQYELYVRWDKLNSLLGCSTGDKFRKIALSYVLSSLIRSANVYMSQFTDRYTLDVIAGEYVIYILDAYQGYTRRAVSTISGGESFLVSLALALALSDIGSTLSVDTLFIDEGFGTLSGEPLENAVTTLRSLHSSSGRRVGIISHKEELQEKIPVQIKVDQDGHSSSSRISVVP